MMGEPVEHRSARRGVGPGDEQSTTLGRHGTIRVGGFGTRRRGQCWHPESLPIGSFQHAGAGGLVPQRDPESVTIVVGGKCGIEVVLDGGDVVGGAELVGGTGRSAVVGGRSVTGGIR